MATSFFTQYSGVIPRLIKDYDQNLLTIQVSSTGKVYTGMVIPNTEAKQPFRQQIDVALNGSTYMLAAGKGAGSYKFVVIDGPYLNCKNFPKSTFLQFIQTKNVEDRKITVIPSYTYAGTYKQGVFTGYITDVASTVTESEEDCITYYTTVTATGTWS